MNFEAEELFAELGKLYMTTVKLTQQLAAAQAPATEEEPTE